MVYYYSPSALKLYVALLQHLVIKALYMGQYFHCHIITVGIWCDLLGSIHMWENPLCWYSCHDSAESAQQWAQAGQTQQCHLLR